MFFGRPTTSTNEVGDFFLAGSCDDIFAFSLRCRPSFRVKYAETYHLRMFQHVSLYFSAVFLCFLRGAAATKKIPRRPRPATRGDQFFDDLDPACRIFLELFHDPRPRTLQIPRPTTWMGGRGRGTTAVAGCFDQSCAITRGCRVRQCQWWCKR